MNTHIGLYFPYFQFPDDKWVKLSALYWDKMYRIVPYAYKELEDSKVVSEFQKINFIDNIQPEKHDRALENIKIEFLRLIVKHEKELVRNYGIDSIDNWPDSKYLRGKSVKGLNPKLAHIFHLKIETELAATLYNTKLADFDGQWMGMHPKLANVYMSALAETLASSAQFSPITDEPINYFAVSGFTFERLAQVLLSDATIVSTTLSEEEIEGELAVLAFQAVMPKNVDDVSVEKILEIRKKHMGQLGKFQDVIHGIVNKLPNLKLVESQEFVYDHLDAEYRKNIKPKLDELDDSMKSIGMETVPTVINMEVKIPTIIASGGLLAGALLINPILGATAGVAMGLSKIIGDKRKAIKDEIRKSDVAYLMNIRDDLTPAGSLNWLNIQSRKLLFGI